MLFYCIQNYYYCVQLTFDRIYTLDFQCAFSLLFSALKAILLQSFYFLLKAPLSHFHHKSLAYADQKIYFGMEISKLTFCGCPGFHGFYSRVNYQSDFLLMNDFFILKVFWNFYLDLVIAYILFLWFILLENPWEYRTIFSAIPLWKIITRCIITTWTLTLLLSIGATSDLLIGFQVAQLFLVHDHCHCLLFPEYFH